MIGDFFSEAMALDGRLLKTLLALMVPARLTKDYFNGIHKPYYSPLRILLFSSVILLGLLSLGEVNMKIDSKSVDFVKHRVELLDQNARIDSALQVSKHDQIIEEKTIDSLRRRMIATGALSGKLRDSVEINVGSFFTKISIKELHETDARLLAKKYAGDKSLITQILVTQSAKAMKEGSNMIHSFMKKSTFLLLILIPLLGLFLMLIYRGYFYIEHTVLMMNTHSFTILSLVVAILLSRLLPQYTDGIFWTQTGISALYIVFSIRSYYGQSWFYTLLKSIIIFIAYAFLLAVSVALYLAIMFIVF